MSILPPLSTFVLQDSFFCRRLATLTSPNSAAPNIHAAAGRGTIDALTISASSTCPSTSESIAEAPFFDIPATVDTSTLISASTTSPLVSARPLPNSASPVVRLITAAAALRDTTPRAINANVATILKRCFAALIFILYLSVLVHAHCSLFGGHVKQ